MIHVDRSAVPVPQSLTSGRAVQEVAKIASLLEKQDLREQVRVEFKAEIYNSVRGNLLSLFHGKCAYCESDIAATQAAEIEHFRPKQGASDLEGKKREHLYYAWLAYDWDNLLLACAACGRRRTSEGRIVGKGDRFPVEGERARLMSTVAQCREKETALLIDPCFDEPSEHLRFNDDGTCEPLSERGSVTVALLDLNREELIEARERTAQRVNTLARRWTSLTLDQEGNAPSELEEVQELLAGSRPYTAVARNAFVRFLDDLQRGASGQSTPSVAPDSDPQLLREAAAALRVAVSQRWLPDQQVTAEQKSKVASEIAQTATSAPSQYEGRVTLPPYAQARLTRVTLRNFKAIEELQLEIPQRAADSNESAGMLMLLGENATGKSSVLEAIALALLGTKQIGKLNVDPKSYVRRNLDWTTRADTAAPTRVELWFEGMTAPRTLEIDSSGRFQGDPDPATVLLGYGPRRFFQPMKANFLRDFFNWGTAPFERVRTLFDPVATITNPSDWLAKVEPAQFNAVVRALRKLLMLEDDAPVHPPTGKGGDSEITFTVDGLKVPLSYLSEGYRTIVATGVDVMREMLRYWPDLESAQGIVLIDEVETHLHPRWKMRIVRLLRQAMPRVQFIMTTHDPLCLRGLDDGEVSVVFRDEERRIARVEDLPSVTGLSVQQLLTSEYFGLFTTEDPRVEAQLASYVALVNNDNRTDDEEQELQVQREITMKRLVPGALPTHRVAYEAINSTLRLQAEQARYKRADLNRDAMSKAIDLFTATSTES